ncbi:hypothetical protein KR222_000607 [Zaprionus bogoriensis]|nr:hypothetical protein KR222_000607 [Zaprionus bogoriensis]
MLSVFLVVFLVAAGQQVLGCAENQFHCGDGTCISNTLKCDQKKDCDNNSDEAFATCYLTKCNDEDQFRCSNGGCINSNLTCNKVKDCLDGSDENKFVCAEDDTIDLVLKDLLGNCNETYALQCVVDDAMPGKKGCLTWSQVCDGQVNCPNARDESLELCAGSTCPSNSFRCEMGTCIESSKLCDKELDCFDGSDELPEICAPKIKKPEEPSSGPHSETESPPIVGHWVVPGCTLEPQPGMLVSDYFSEFSYKSDALVKPGTVVAISCASGYEPFASHIYACKDNGWTTSTFEGICKRVCDQSVDVRNRRYSTQCLEDGSIVNCEDATSVVNTELQVKCARGYQAADSGNAMGVHKCDINGDWSVETENPVCEPICGVKSTYYPEVTPWTVSIFKREKYYPDYYFKCLGTILSAYVVITSEECFQGTEVNASRIYYSLVEGNYNISYKPDGEHGYTLHNLERFHKVTYIKNELHFQAVILTVATPFKFGPRVRPVCFNRQTEQNEFELVTEHESTKDQVGQGITEKVHGKYWLTDFVHNVRSRYNVRGFLRAISDDIKKSEKVI